MYDAQKCTWTPLWSLTMLPRPGMLGLGFKAKIFGLRLNLEAQDFGLGLAARGLHLGFEQET